MRKVKKQGVKASSHPWQMLLQNHQTHTCAPALPWPQDGWGSSSKLTLHYQCVHKTALSSPVCCSWAALAVLFVQETPKPWITHMKAKIQCLIQLYYNAPLSLEVNEQPFLRVRALGRLAFTEHEDLTPSVKYNLQPYQKCPSDFFCNTHHAQCSLAAAAKQLHRPSCSLTQGLLMRISQQNRLERGGHQLSALPLMCSDWCRIQGRHSSAGRDRQSESLPGPSVHLHCGGKLQLEQQLH